MAGLISLLRSALTDLLSEALICFIKPPRSESGLDEEASTFLEERDTVGSAHKRIAAFDEVNGITSMLAPIDPFETNEWHWITSKD